MSRGTALAIIAAMASSDLLAADRAAQGAIDAAVAAMRRGHGSMCSLEALPVDRGGYWHCLDIGPYRFVVEYGKVKVFVTGKDMPPFPILESRDGVSEYLVTGPWAQDLPRRTEAWWNDEVEGQREKREAGQADGSRRSRAEGLVRTLIDAETPKSEPAPQPTPSAQAPARAPQAGQPLPPGGIQVAPGVVRLPDGPQRR